MFVWRLNNGICQQNSVISDQIGIRRCTQPGQFCTDQIVQCGLIQYQIECANRRQIRI